MRRYVRKTMISIAVLVVLAVAAASALVWWQLPDRKAPPIAGLSANVTASLDDRGIPTVRAETMPDALRAQGYLVARERLFQLELMRRVAEGTLSEVFGSSALPTDRLHRLYGFKQIAQEAVPLVPGDEREALEAFAAGVNAFITSHPGRLGLEFDLLGITPRPWAPADSIGVLLLMYEDLASTWKDELFAESVARLPAPMQRFLMPRVSADDHLLIPDADPRPVADETAIFVAPHAELAPALAIPPDAFGLPPFAGLRGSGIGSNNWVISGQRTKSGKPLLANDPHLGLECPGTWFAMRIEIANRWVQGVTVVGLPGIVIGQNDKVAWGFTNLGTDVQDVYREPATSERVETIAVSGAPAETMRVPLGAHGPQVRPGYSLKWVALDPKNLRVPMAAIMQASDWASFNAAFDGFLGPAQNVVYADAAGHIGWRAVGLVPIRRDSDDGSMVKDGANAGDEWRGFVPMSELPRVFDPPEGYLVTANQRVVGTSFPHVIATRWASSNRARRIAELIEQTGKLDRVDMERIQFDVVSPLHRDLMRAVASAVSDPSLSDFTTWDGAARADDARFLDAVAWESSLRAALRTRILGGESDPSWAWRDGAMILAALRADDATWVRAGLGDKASLLRDASAAARAYRAKHPERTWGEYNALRITHPFGAAGGVLGWLFNPGGFPQPGSESTVRATGPSYGQSMRLIVDWSAPEATTFVMPLGESGHLWSAHRTDQQAAWRDGDRGGELTRFSRPPQGSPLVFSPR